MRAVGLLFSSLFIAAFPSFAQTSPDLAQSWIGTWGVSPAPQLSAEDQVRKAGLLFENQTVREIVHVSAGGSQVRLRISNAYGKQSVHIAGVHVAVVQKDAAIVPGTDRAVTFGGRASVVVPPDALLLSDPVSLDLQPSANLAISLFLPEKTAAAGIHYSAQQTNFVASGNATSAEDLPSATHISSYAFLTGVDVSAAVGASTLVAFGDSITDGAASTANANHRWPNYLAARLLGRSSAPVVGVLDEGIGGNRILHDPNANIAFGVNALARFDRDVLSQPGVKYVIVLEGINDLGHAGPSSFPEEQVSADDIIAGLRQLTARAHEKGLKIFGATLTPFTGTVFPGYFSPAKEVERQKVNQWIRSSKDFDGVIDFEKAVADPAHPERMAPSFDSGDHLHPKDEGYQAMANCIDLSLFH